MTLGTQIIYLFVLAIPVACITWTFTHEELFRESHEYFVARSQQSKHLLVRKFFFLLTCEYCFSHYISIAAVAVTDYHLLLTNWIGYIIGGFSMVWIANIYMSLFYLIRIDIKKEKITVKEKELENSQNNQDRPHLQ